MGWCRKAEHNWERRVVLLTAVAGTGKSAVPHTIAHRCAGHLALELFYESRPSIQHSKISSYRTRVPLCNPHVRFGGCSGTNMSFLNCSSNVAVTSCSGSLCLNPCVANHPRKCDRCLGRV